MKVRLKVTITGLRNGVPWPPVGETVEVPDNEGADLCAADLAEPVVEDKAEKRPAAKRAEKRD